jgi:REP element-mobilizing transposase RayT
MSRKHREYVPGAVFHVAARTQGRAPWFTEPLRPIIRRIIFDVFDTSDARLLAFAVMRNHFHIILVQGRSTLGTTMQLMQRRIALLAQNAHDLKGHVFERRFRSRLCGNPRYVRRAIIYAHLNPIRRKLHLDLCTSAHCSHGIYLQNHTDAIAAVDSILALRLFAYESSDTVDAMRSRYAEYVEWRRCKYLHDDAGLPYDDPEPRFPAGDKYFLSAFQHVPLSESDVARADLRDYAADLLLSISQDFTLDQLRGPFGRRDRILVRNELICALLAARYRSGAIARFFRVSPATVSVIAGAIRPCMALSRRD